MHNTNNSNTAKPDKWDDNAVTVAVTAAVVVLVVVMVEVEVIVARRNGHIMQIDLVCNAGRTSSNIWHDEKQFWKEKRKSLIRKTNK